MPRSSPIATLALLAGACFYDTAPEPGATTEDASSETTAAATTDPTTGLTTVDITTTTTSSTSSSSDTGGSTSSGADETTLDTTTGADPGLYGPCDMAAACPSGQQCLSIMQASGSFCSPACVGMECPAAPPGVTAQPSCSLTEARGMDPVNCALICDVLDATACPTGLVCKPLDMLRAGLCAAP